MSRKCIFGVQDVIPYGVPGHLNRLSASGGILLTPQSSDGPNVFGPASFNRIADVGGCHSIARNLASFDRGGSPAVKGARP